MGFGVVTGMAQEAALVQGALCHGPGPRAAESAARALLAGGAEGLISFGLAAGLDPDLPAGTVILAEGVIDPDGVDWSVDVLWRTELAAQLPHETGGRIAGIDSPVTTVDGKHHLWQRCHAQAADMESHAVARVAHQAHRPFACVRVIADPAGHVVPPLALRGLRPDGSLDRGAVIRGVLSQPGQLPALIRLGRDHRIAMIELSAVAACLRV